jgi:predicted PolB exonuclease-like 3'-5' exonuclease
MLKNLDLINVLVLDIETVSSHKSLEDMSPDMQKLWGYKADSIQRRVEEADRLPLDEVYVENAGIYAEFGKILCISVGVFRRDKETGKLHFHVKSYFGHDERLLLLEFTTLIEKHYNNPKKHYLCGHNIKEFDVPYICRRMIVNGLALPDALDLPGKKPWELEHLLDTMTLWKFGDYKAYTSLKLLCGLFEIPTPKDDIDGSQVGKTYWNEGDVDRIEVYCKKDVVATARVLARMMLHDPMGFEVHTL